MGQANKRGTFEQRAAWANARNKAVIKFIGTAAKDKEEEHIKSSLRIAANRKGIQSVASYLERNGMLTIGTKSISQ